MLTTAAAKKPEQPPAPVPATRPTEPKGDPQPEIDDEERKLLEQLDRVRRRKAEEAVKKAEQASGEIQRALEKVSAPSDGRWWVTRSAGVWTVHAANGAAARAPRASNSNAAGGRDARLPAPGTSIERPYKGRILRVTFSASDEVEVDGTRFGTVSSAAKALTGVSTNGFAFFNLK